MGIAILIKTKQKEQLDQFANRVFEGLSITNFERRESSNYSNGEYYVGLACGLKVKIMMINTAFQDYRYELVIDYQVFTPQERHLEDLLIDYFARLLTINDYDVAVLDGPSQDSPIYAYKVDTVAKSLENKIIVVRVE